MLIYVPLQFYTFGVTGKVEVDKLVPVLQMHKIYIGLKHSQLVIVIYNYPHG